MYVCSYKWPRNRLTGPFEWLAYFDELEASLKFIRETHELSIDEKKRFFKSANTNLGKTVSL